MSSVAKSLYVYLTGDDAISGASATPFSPAQTVGNYTVADREEARENLRGLIGNRIYLNRRPQNTSDHTAMEIRTLDLERAYRLSGEVNNPEEFLNCRFYARGGTARDRVDLAASMFALAVSGFYDDTWGDRQIESCLIDSESGDAIDPDDGSDDWVFVRTVDLRVFHRAPIAAIPGIKLQALFSFVDAAGVGDDLRVSDSSTVPEGATITDIAWVVRTGSESGPIAVQFNGAPDVAVVTADVDGTYRQPAIDRTAYGLSSGTIHVQQTVTDSYGGTSIYSDSQTS